MNKLAEHRRAVMLVLTAVILLGLTLLVWHEVRKQTFIDTQPVTARIKDTQAQEGNLDLNELIGNPITAEWNTGDILYNAVLYPDAEMVICTINASENVEALVPYLVHSDGWIEKGEYLPDGEKYGVQKIAFQEVGWSDIGWLDMVDERELAGREYESEMDIRRVRFWIDETQTPTWEEAYPDEDWQA